MSESQAAAPQSAEQIAGVVGMQMRRDIDAFRARDYWRRTLASTPAEEVVDGLVLALSTRDHRPACGAVTINVQAAPGVDVAALVKQLAALGRQGGTA